MTDTKRDDFLKQLYTILDAAFTTKMPANLETHNLPAINNGLVYATQCVGHMLYKHRLGLEVLKFKEISLMYDHIEQEFVVDIPMINDVYLEFVIVLLKTGETVDDQVEIIADDFIRHGIRGICSKFTLTTDTFVVNQDVASPNDKLDNRLLFALDIQYNKPN